MMKQMDYEWAPDVSSKEPYLHPQPDGLLTVRDFLFTNRDGRRHVLLRWNMEANFKVDRFTFELKQLDPVDECLETVTVTYQGTDIPPIKQGEPFVPAHGIAVREKCTDIRVQLIEVVSEDYVYRVKGTRAEVEYRSPTPWRYDKQGGREDGLSDKVSLRVFSKRHGKVHFRWPIAILSVVLLLLVIVLPYLLSEKKDTSDGDRRMGVEETVDAASVPRDLEDSPF